MGHRDRGVRPPGSSGPDFSRSISAGSSGMGQSYSLLCHFVTATIFCDKSIHGPEHNSADASFLSPNAGGRIKAAGAIAQAHAEGARAEPHRHRGVRQETLDGVLSGTLRVAHSTYSGRDHRPADWRRASIRHDEPGQTRLRALVLDGRRFRRRSDHASIGSARCVTNGNPASQSTDGVGQNAR